MARVLRARRGVPSVLIVDDDPSVIESLRSVLPSDIRLTGAAGAADANALVESGEYCGLVLDLVLADGTGFDVLRHMKERGMSVPTVVVTERLPSYVREMLDQDQVRLVFPKPVAPRVLAAVVLGLCGMR